MRHSRAHLKGLQGMKNLVNNILSDWKHFQLPSLLLQQYSWPRNFLHVMTVVFNVQISHAYHWYCTTSTVNMSTQWTHGLSMHWMTFEVFLGGRTLSFSDSSSVLNGNLTQFEARWFKWQSCSLTGSRGGPSQKHLVAVAVEMSKILKAWLNMTRLPCLKPTMTFFGC